MAVNYATHKTTKGLGPIDAHGTQGVLVHSVLGVSPDGVPCGLLHQQVWSRDPEEKRTKEERKKLPIEEKESYRWLESVEATKNAVSSETHIITVADREADIFELFVLPRPNNMDLLIRATQNRRVQGDRSQSEETLGKCGGGSRIFRDHNHTFGAYARSTRTRCDLYTAMANPHYTCASP